MRASMHVTSTTGPHRMGLEIAVVERGDEAFVVLEELVGCTHASPVSHPPDPTLDTGARQADRG